MRDPIPANDIDHGKEKGDEIEDERNSIGMGSAGNSSQQNNAGNRIGSRH